MRPRDGLYGAGDRPRARVRALARTTPGRRSEPEARAEWPEHVERDVGGSAEDHGDHQGSAGSRIGGTVSRPHTRRSAARRQRFCEYPCGDITRTLIWRSPGFTDGVGVG